jgi:hypothetical protein
MSQSLADCIFHFYQSLSALTTKPQFSPKVSSERGVCLNCQLQELQENKVNAQVSSVRRVLAVRPLSVTHGLP